MSKRVAWLTAIEANPYTFKLLEMNVRINDCANMDIHHVAANDVGGEIEFVCNTVNSGGSKRMPLRRETPYFDDEPEVLMVPAARLDGLLAGRQYDLVFMDIEGSEVFAMRGMPRILAGAATVVTEFVPHHLQCVAGITVAQFLEPLRDFQTLIVPSRGECVHGDEIQPLLEYMCNHGENDEGIAFLRDRAEANFEDKS